MKKKITLLLVLIMIATAGLVGCSTPKTETNNETPKEEVKLAGEILIDGSSTVFPATEAVAEEFRHTHPEVRVPIGVSGTGGGFKKFTNNETDISNASRPIKSSEAELAVKNGVEYVEFKVAFEGLSVLVNPQNDFVDYLTVEELNRIWGPESTVKTWKDVRAEWPAEEIKLYSPGTDSGTFDYFTEVINGKAGAMRPDFTASEDDHVLVQGVAGDKYAISFFGYSYYVENKDKLKLVKIDNGSGPVAPSFETIQNNTYAPLSRPIFVYANKKSLEKPEVKAFMSFYLENAKKLLPEIGFIALPDSEYTKQLNQIK